MAAPTRSIIDTRGDQMFPTLDAGRDRPHAPLRRGAPLRGRRSPVPCRPGRARRLGRAGRRGRDHAARRSRPGAADRHASAGRVHGRARPALGAARAWSMRLRASRVEVLVIPPDRLRALLVAEAELGERIMRALILRRVGLLETGAGGPVIVGRPDSGDVLRLAGFLRRNGHPHLRLDPDTDAEAKALIERFHVDPGELPIVLCPGGQLLRNPSEVELARCIGLVGPIDPDRVYDVAVVGAGPAGLATAVYAASEGLSVRRARLPLVRRPGRRLGADRELPRLSDRHHRHGADGARLQPGAEIRRRDGDPGRGRRAGDARAPATRRASRCGSATTSACAPARW